MKRLLLICVLFACACGKTEPTKQPLASSPSPAGPAHLEELVTSAAGAHCTADGVWCASAQADAKTIAFCYRHAQVASFQFAEDGYDVWPKIIRTPRGDGGEDALVGISHMAESAYSGGGGQATQVSLYALSSTAAQRPAHPALTFPASAELDIRACFSEEDTRMRREACSDQYNFTGTLSLDTSAAPVKLVLVTEATTYPAGISRSADNTRQLGANDLHTERDPTCSYRRVFSWDAATQTYAPDAPLPACSDYLEP